MQFLCQFLLQVISSFSVRSYSNSESHKQRGNCWKSNRGDRRDVSAASEITDAVRLTEIQLDRGAVDRHQIHGRKLKRDRILVARVADIS